MISTKRAGDCLTNEQGEDVIESGFINGDCMNYLKEYPDNYFDLCIADPPYGEGLGEGGGSKGWFTKYNMKMREGETDSVSTSTATRRTHYTFGLRKKRRNYENRRNMGDKIRKKIITWDVAPEKSFFDEIFRISRNQIIWGG